MAPRRRPRKLGTSRMDAAIDAMIPFGFPKELVRAKMKNLLKEYGGDVGYPFIEAESYKVLIDTILAGEEEESKQREHSSKICAEGKSLLKDESLEDDGTGNYITLVPPPQHQIMSPRWNDIGQDQSSSQDIRYSVVDSPLLLIAASSSSSPAALKSNPTRRRRRPCYGWISDGDGDGEDTFVILTPAIAPSPSPSPSAHPNL